MLKIVGIASKVINVLGGVKSAINKAQGIVKVIGILSDTVDFVTERVKAEFPNAKIK